MKGLTAVNNVIRNYINKTYTLVIILTTGSTTIAGATFLLMKMFGLYPDVSYTGLGIFLATCVIYLITGFIFIKTAFSENLDGGKSLKPGMLTAGKIFLNILLVVQFNFIAYLTPSRDYWAFAFYFVIVMSFLLAFKFVSSGQGRTFCGGLAAAHYRHCSVRFRSSASRFLCKPLPCQH